MTRLRVPSGLVLVLAACGGTPQGSVDASSAGPDAAPGPVTLTKVRTEHLGRLIGTSRTPLAPVGLTGTDLGVTFERDGKLWFLFGDSWTTPADTAFWNDDSVAWTTPALPAGGAPPPLFWLLDPATPRFLSLLVPTIDLKGMNVPVDAVPVGATTYLFASTGWSDATQTHSTSVLAHTTGSAFGSLVLDHAVPSTKFINISAVTDGGTVYLFGSGPYRKSPVYLATALPQSLADRSSWRYWNGSAFAAGEMAATPLVDVSCVGELSVRRHPTLGLWLMTYNCGAPRGIVLRSAPAATGPWSAGQVIFDPGADAPADLGYATFMHGKTSVLGYDDGLSEPGREEEWGGEYGPYLIPSFYTDDAPGVHTIYYTLSSWNPYLVHLMRTVLVEPSGVAPPPANAGLGLPPTTLRNGDFGSNNFDGWTGEGDAFTLFVGPDGKNRVTTYVGPKNDAVVGKLWQDFTVDAQTSEMDFTVHGGHASVKLYRGSDLVRMTRGRDQNSPELPVRWRIAEYRGQTLRVVIDDDQPTGPWGFIGCSGFTFR